MQSTCHPDWTISFKTLAVFWNKQAWRQCSHISITRTCNAWSKPGYKCGLSSKPETWEQPASTNARRYRWCPCAHWVHRFAFFLEAQTDPASGYNMLQRIRNVLQVSGRRCYNVSGASYKLLDKDVTTDQERLTSCWTKMLQRIRSVLQVKWTKMLQRIRSVLQVAGRRCYNTSENRDWHRRPQDVITPPPQPPQKPTPKHPLKNRIKYWFGFPRVG